MLSIEPTEGMLIPRNAARTLARPAVEEVDSDDEDEEERAKREARARASDSVRLTVKLTPNALGTVRELVPLKLSGQADRVIDVSANVVEQKLILALPDKGDYKVLLGPTHYGNALSAGAGQQWPAAHLVYHRRNEPACCCTGLWLGLGLWLGVWSDSGSDAGSDRRHR